ncbi:MAG: bifunctional 5,10-methylenetetrahydrofolate dehydrogenase/5,10-methenyltetrahydrofolate cyclohydrolase [Anaerolineae bacterium]
MLDSPNRAGQATYMDGRALASAMLDALAAEVSSLASGAHISPGLAIVHIGQDAATASYLRAIIRCCNRTGIGSRTCSLASTASPRDLAELLDDLAGDPAISGIIVQLPVPADMRSVLLSHMPPHKDVDGIHPLNAGLLALGDPSAFVPATPLGGMALLQHYGVEIEGCRAVVVGRSPVVGRPMSLLLLQANATVTVCHTRTRDLGEASRTADVLVLATGRPRMITADMVQPGATVIDFGVNFVDGQMTGDVDTAAVAQVAARITPVPGGTGPMTNVMLMQNTLRAAQRLREGR